MPLTVTQLENGLLVEGVQDFSLSQILDCGQCFTFSKLDSADPLTETWHGTAGGRYLKIAQRQDGALLFYNTSPALFEQFWKSYFDLDTDYAHIKSILSQDSVLAKATQYAPGIRILRQNAWEALCCFIISQNNNIKRIRGIVERLCQRFGEELEHGFFSFPAPAVLAGCCVEDLAPLHCGFRAKYLIDAAQKIHSGEIDLQAIAVMPLAQARSELMKIYGVGPKVADCALLYGFYRLECCPMDVWMKRVFAILYPNGLPDCAKDYIGIAQQYLFHYARTCPQAFEPKQEILKPTPQEVLKPTPQEVLA